MTRPEELARVTAVDLSGRHFLVTGSTDGIGREAALALGRLGADVTVHGRDEEKGRGLLESLEQVGSTCRFYAADFEEPSEVSGLADAVRDEPGDLDVLVNNAGALYREPHLAWGGVEATLAVNHLAPFLLTEELRPLLDRKGGRIVNVSSDMHRRATLDLEAVESLDNYSATRAYSVSKLANVMHVYALSRRLRHATANALHPGMVPGSGLYRTMPLPVRAVVGLLGRVHVGPIKTVGEGAATSVHLAASPEVEDVTAGYFNDCTETVSSEESYDREKQDALWSFSEMARPEP
ncbi:MAG: L-rhamnose 1-dehydrogenase (NADP(+)) [Methanonatronarchaeales archaeon]|nr:L-rhamnose 1-dehydrogenase (NADP(+)) [Methanonatronarchaeales archaeon]